MKEIQVRDYLTEDEIRRKIETAKKLRIKQRFIVILEALRDPSSFRSIADRSGVTHNCVRELIAKYNRHGPGALEKHNNGNHHRANGLLTREEEQEFVNPFLESAKKGKIPQAASIRKALEERLGRAVHSSTIYRMKERCGWKKKESQRLRGLWKNRS